jgi:hypothetical protein
VKMMGSLDSVTIRDGEGVVKPLVAAKREISKPVDRKPEREGLAERGLGFLIAGVAMGGLLYALALSGTRGSGGATTAFATVATIWCAFAGIAGTLALCMWLFSLHTFMHMNETVMLMGPLHLILAVLLPASVRRSFRIEAALIIAGAIVALSTLAAVLHLIPGLGQANQDMINLTVWPNLALFFGLRRFRLRPLVIPAEAGIHVR